MEKRSWIFWLVPASEVCNTSFIALILRYWTFPLCVNFKHNIVWGLLWKGPDIYLNQAAECITCTCCLYYITLYIPPPSHYCMTTVDEWCLWWERRLHQQWTHLSQLPVESRERYVTCTSTKTFWVLAGITCKVLQRLGLWRLTSLSWFSSLN